MAMAESGPTKPAAGVMATSPATAPEAAPRTVGLPRCTHSANIQESIAADAAIWVTTNALVERPPAARALPALNPNQPNQRIPAPKTVIGRLWGAMFSAPCPRRFPATRTAASALAPEVMWTTVPPAKSRAPRPRVPPADPPDPVGDRVIDEKRPEADEQQKGRELDPLRERPCDERRGDDGKHRLVDHEGLVGNGRPVVRVRFEPHTPESEPGQVPDQALHVRAKGKRVPDEEPLDAHQSDHDHRLPDRFH